MKLKTDGLILREQNIGESDRLVSVLTGDYGVVRAFVRSARKVKSNMLSSTALLTYSSFTLYTGKVTNSISEAEPSEVFCQLRSDITKLALAQYFCELAGELSPQDIEGTESREYLRVVLNALHFLAKEKKSPELLKAIVELRLMSLSGYMPNLVACSECGKYLTDIMFFDLVTGLLYCKSCRPAGDFRQVSARVVEAMRHIALSDMERLFSLSLSPAETAELSAVTQEYLLIRTQHAYKTLDFYKTVR